MRPTTSAITRSSRQLWRPLDLRTRAGLEQRRCRRLALLEGQLRVERQAQGAVGKRLADRKAAAPPTAVEVRGSGMRQQRVVDRRLDAPFPKRPGTRDAICAADRKERPDGLNPRA